MNYDWKLGLLWEYREAFWNGLQVTLLLTASSIAFGLAIGVPLGVVLSTKGPRLRPVRALIYTYNAVFGWLPVLVLLVWMYYMLPSAFGLRPSALTVSIVALSLNLSAFVADIVRGAIGRVSAADIDAARAVGMGTTLRLRRIIMPEVFRNSLPPLIAIFINQFKWTTLASVIGVQELLHTADTIMIRTYRSLEAYTAIALIYLVVVGLMSMAYMLLERHPFFRQRR
jgi:His/Glu/Gln/Arg/opine family amino acid ABC transporter permease subunit